MKYFKPIYTQFKALNVRERVLAVAALLGVMYFVFDFAMVRPQLAQAKSLREKVAQLDGEVESQKNLMKALSVPVLLDPLAALRAERDELRSTFTQATMVITHASGNTRMSDVVRSMVTVRPGLTLVALRTLPVDVFFKAAAPPPPPTVRRGAPAPAEVAPPAAPQPVLPTLYKHGIELTVQGSYPALVSYLRELEHNTSGIFWHSAKLDVVAFPEATLKVVIYTLSARPSMPLS